MANDTQITLIYTLMNFSMCVSVGFPHAVHRWRDCTDIFKAGHSTSGLYDIYITNISQPVQVKTPLSLWFLLASVLLL